MISEMDIEDGGDAKNIHVMCISLAGHVFKMSSREHMLES